MLVGDHGHAPALQPPGDLVCGRCNEAGTDEDIIGPVAEIDADGFCGRQINGSWSWFHFFGRLARAARTSSTITSFLTSRDSTRQVRLSIDWIAGRA